MNKKLLAFSLIVIGVLIFLLGGASYEAGIITRGTCSTIMAVGAVLFCFTTARAAR